MEQCVRQDTLLITRGDSELRNVTHLAISVNPQCDIIPVQETVEEIDARARDIPVIQYPDWVRVEYINQIRGLKCFETVRELLIAGIPTIEVARKIHQLGELKHIKLSTVEQRLFHYRVTIPKWLMAVGVAGTPQQYLEVKKASDSIDVLEKLTSIYEMIEERLRIGMGIDRKFNIVTPNLEKTFLVAATILDKIQMMKERTWTTKEDQKFISSKSSGIDWGKVYSRQSVAKVMENPDSRARVLKIAERLVDLYGQKLKPEQVDVFRRTREVIGGEVK